MFISEYSKATYFQILKDDDDYVILNKRLLLEHDRIASQLHIQERLNDFENKYNEIKRLKKGGRTTDELKMMIAIEALVN